MKKYIAELLGSYALVFFGTGAIIISELHPDLVSHGGVGAAFGLVVMGVIFAFGEISGAHVNPAVTLAFSVAKKFPRKEIVPFIVAQVLGALLASFTLKFLVPGTEYLGATLPSGGVLQSFIMEFILTYFLMIVIINVSTGSKEVGTMAAIAIGGVVALEALVMGPICGASMNPARSIGPAIASGHLEHLWLYIIAPILGAILAVFTCSIYKGKECC